MASLLLTGIPGVGKTTVLRKVAASLSTRELAGFITEEIRSKRGREGFRLITLDGRQSTMAHIAFRTQHKVGKYGIDVEAIDRLAESALRSERHVELYLIDEIGKMECLSGAFVAVMRAVLDSGKLVVATVAAKGEGFIDEVKKRRDSVLWEVTRKNRDLLPDSILEWISGKLEQLP